MAQYVTRALDNTTWPDFAALVEKHNGIWGGCWCMNFHPEGWSKPRTAEMNRRDKEQKVCEGRAHAALVYDSDRCVGWCQFGSPDELPRIANRKTYEKGLDSLPQWRITCFFVDKSCRRQGVAPAALKGALTEIAKLGGGIVEGYPDETEGRKVSASFIHNGTVALFAKHGFELARQIGKRLWVVRKVVDPTTI